MIEMELGDRAVSALYEENAGSIYHRINVVRGRAMDAVFARVSDQLEKIADKLEETL